jgi:hypothetical protein
MSMDKRVVQPSGRNNQTSDGTLGLSKEDDLERDFKQIVEGVDPSRTNGGLTNAHKFKMEQTAFANNSNTVSPR